MSNPYPDYSKGVFTKSEHGAKLAELGWQEIDCPICGGGARAFPKPPQRTWVGLTDEEVNQLYTQIQEQVDKHWTDGGTSMMFPTTLYKAFEAKLKEKNT